MNIHPPKLMIAIFQAFLPDAHDGSYNLIISQVIDGFGECSPTEIVSKIMKLCDYDAEKKNLINSI